MTADEMNSIWRAHGSNLQLPANPTTAQLALARLAVGIWAGIDGSAAKQAAEDERVAQLASDPSRKAAYDAARSECHFDTETLFPGWTPQPLMPNQQADADNLASQSQAGPPSWVVSDPVVAALRDEGGRLIPLSHGPSAQARAIRAEINRLWGLASVLGRQESRRRRRETPGTWPRLVPWPSTCQVCGVAFDPTVAWPDPLSESLGHEPPIRWVARHPDYDGPRVLRPEHLFCNMAKRDRSDSEMGDDMRSRLRRQSRRGAG